MISWSTPGDDLFLFGIRCRIVILSGAVPTGSIINVGAFVEYRYKLRPPPLPIGSTDWNRPSLAEYDRTFIQRSSLASVTTPNSPMNWNALPTEPIDNRFSPKGV